MWFPAMTVTGCIQCGMKPVNEEALLIGTRSPDAVRLGYAGYRPLTRTAPRKKRSEH
jgi:hypothetical protein